MLGSSMLIGLTISKSSKIIYIILFYLYLSWMIRFGDDLIKLDI